MFYMFLGNLKKFWCLEGFVAIIFLIFTACALSSGRYLSAILMAIFTYWWMQRVLSKPIPRSKRTNRYNLHSNRDLDL
jgi:hypothetical protein